MQNITEQ